MEKLRNVCHRKLFWLIGFPLADKILILWVSEYAFMKCLILGKIGFFWGIVMKIREKNLIARGFRAGFTDFEVILELVTSEYSKVFWYSYRLRTLISNRSKNFPKREINFFAYLIVVFVSRTLFPESKVLINSLELLTLNVHS